MLPIYVLPITAAAKQSHSVGQITNLAAIDTEKIFLAAQFPHFLWQGPITCIIVLSILITEVGWAPALAGIAWLGLLVPVQDRIGKWWGGGEVGEARLC
jgi:hypothetical protein